jgi:hypothetical protein
MNLAKKNLREVAPESSATHARSGMVTPVMAAQPPSVAERTPAWVAASGLLPALIAAAHLDLYSGGGRDAGVVRAVGLGYSGAFRALDAWVAAPFAALPIGTRALRSSLPGVLMLAIAAGLVFVVARRRLTAIAGRSAWSSIVAAVASATVSLSFPYQHESGSPASGVTGVVLVLAALVLADGPAASAPLLAAVLTLAVSYDPAIGGCVAVALIVTWLAAGPRRGTEPDGEAPPPGRLPVVGALLAGAAGLVPSGLAVLRGHATPLSTSARALAAASWPAGPRVPLTSIAAMRHVLGTFRAELGDLLLLVALAGFVWALVHPRGRRAALPLAAVTLTAGVAVVSGTANGAALDVWSPVALVTLAGLVAFAGVAMQEAVLRVARARLPLASASASMVVLLEAAFPVILLDDGLTRPSARVTLAMPVWEDAAFAALPGGTLVLVSEPRLYARLLATEATGDLPGDLGLIPTFDPSNEAAASALARDARLVPLFRDIVLSGAPTELSMSTLAAARPLAVATDPRWDRTLTRHLIPAGLLAAFEPEPRGGADRKRALEATAAARARLASTLLPHSPAAATSPDPPLTGLTAALLFDRAVGAAAAGEREVATRALADAATFAPKDPRMQRLALAEMAAKWPIDVHELVREGLAGEAP